MRAPLPSVSVLLSLACCACSGGGSGGSPGGDGAEGDAAGVGGLDADIGEELGSTGDPAEDPTASHDPDDAQAAGDEGAADVPLDGATEGGDGELDAGGGMAPVAVAGCRIQGVPGDLTTELLVSPLQTLECSAEGSYDADGRIVGWRWVVSEQPEGSTVRFEPADRRDASLFIDLMGRYLLSLSVVDDDGNWQSGAPGLVEVIATTSENLHVQLVWRTPEAEGSGALAECPALDLHTLHEPGSWLDPVLDCNSSNPHPNWGDPERSDDDPSLSRSGPCGPVNLSLFRPELGATYRIGVEYPDLEGGPATYATLRLYAFGVQQFESWGKPLRPGEFWEVLEYEGGTGQVHRLDVVHPGIP